MIRAVLGILGLGMTLMVTHVQAAVVAPDSAFATFYSRVTAPGKQTISFGSNGTPVVAPGVPSVATAGGPVQVTRTGSLALPAGARLPVTATAKIPNAAIAAIVKKALPLIPYIGTGVALYELSKELGFSLGGTSGAPVVTKPDPNVCSVAPCMQYRNVNVLGNAWSSATAICAAFAARYPSGVTAGLSNSYCVTNYKNTYGQAVQAADFVQSQTIAPLPPVYLPSSDSELSDAIAAKSGWPSGSAVSQAVVDASRLTGDQVSTEQPAIAGPASVAGPVSVSTTPYQDMVKKSTKASNYDCTYVQGATVMEGGSAICTERSVTTDELTKTDPATGIKTTTTTTAEEATKPADIPKDEEQGQAVDSALPGQPTLYKRQYPDGLTGVWNTKKAELLATPLLQLTSNLQPTIAAPSGYPTWPISVVIGHWNFGSYDVSPGPNVWDFLKVCTIIGALFLARALIFGG